MIVSELTICNFNPRRQYTCSLFTRPAVTQHSLCVPPDGRATLNTRCAQKGRPGWVGFQELGCIYTAIIYRHEDDYPSNYTNQLVDRDNRLQVKGWSSGHLLYSAVNMSQAQEQQQFRTSEVAADWHELMILLCIMQPSIVRANAQYYWTHGAASEHTTAPIPTLRGPSSHSPY